MKLVVFGATRGSGRHAVEQALAAGHDVVAVARHPEAIVLRHPRLRVVQGNVLDPASTAAAIAGRDAVLSTVGPSGLGATTLFSAGAGNLIRGMRLAGVRRLICVSATGVDAKSHVAFPQILLLPFLRLLLRGPWADALKMETALRQDLGLDWTVARAPMLTDGPRTGRYRTSLNSYVGNVRRISRADLAEYLLSLLANPASYQAWAEISY
jgi:putative NADH-flavin reductase